MSDLQGMMNRWARAGEVTWIGLRPERRADMKAVQNVHVTESGLDGDRARAGKRAVTLVQAEHLPAIRSYLRHADVTPLQLRRNFVVSGVNLAALKGRLVALGECMLRVSVICAPCSRMEETFGPGGYSAVRGHGGWCAEVVKNGWVQLGEKVVPIDEGEGA